jgi:glutathionylspermidine synthase
MDEYVKKPILGREGANVTVVTRGGEVARGGEYGEEGFVYQKAYKLPDLGGGPAVIGSWVIDCEPRGIGVRESDGPITDDLSRFVPHLFHA